MTIAITIAAENTPYGRTVDLHFKITGYRPGNTDHKTALESIREAIGKAQGNTHGISLNLADGEVTLAAENKETALGCVTRAKKITGLSIANEQDALASIEQAFAPRPRPTYEERVSGPNGARISRG